MLKLWVFPEPPQTDYEALAADFLKLTETDRKSGLLAGFVRQTLEWNPDLQALIDGAKTTVQVMIPAHLDLPFSEAIKLAQEEKLFRIDRAGMAMGTRVGPQASVFQFAAGERITAVREILASTA